MIWRLVTLLSAGLLGGWLGYMVGDREIPVAVAEAAPVQSVVRPGDTARIRFRFWRTRSCWTRANATWIDRNGHRYPIPTLEFPQGELPLGDDTAIVDVPVPIDVPPGPLRYMTVNTYRCNPLAVLWPVTAAPRQVDFWVEG